MRLAKWWLAAYCVLAGGTAVFWRGYQFGTGNQIAHLPVVYRFLDGGYLTNDFYTNAAAEYGPVWWYGQILAVLAQGVGVDHTFLVLTVLANSAIACITAKLASKLNGGRRLATIVAVAMVMSLEWVQIGGASFIYGSILTPMLAAMPWALGAVYAGYGGRGKLAGALVFISGLVHPQVGVFTGGLVWFAGGMKKLWPVGLAITLLGGVWIVPTWGTNYLADEFIIKVLGQTRDPHHHWLPGWPVKDWIELGIFAGVFLLLAKGNKFLLRIFAGVMCLSALGWLGIGVWGQRWGLLIQGFRMLFMVKWTGYIVIAHWVCGNRKIRLGILASGVYSWWLAGREPRITALFGLLLVLGLALWRKKNYLFAVVLIIAMVGGIGRYRVKPVESEMKRLAGEAGRTTPATAVILTPVNWGEFRLLAKRAIVVDWKAFPFGDKAIEKWWQRLQTIYGPDVSQMDEHYNSLGEGQIKELSHKYGFGYAVVYRQNKYMLVEVSRL